MKIRWTWHTGKVLRAIGKIRLCRFPLVARRKMPQWSLIPFLRLEIKCFKTKAFPSPRCTALLPGQCIVYWMYLTTLQLQFASRYWAENPINMVQDTPLTSRAKCNGTFLNQNLFLDPARYNSYFITSRIWFKVLILSANIFVPRSCPRITWFMTKMVLRRTLSRITYLTVL